MMKSFKLKKMKIVAGVSVALLSGAILSGCSSSSSSSDDDTAQDTISAEDKLANAKKVLETNADIAYAAYSDSVTTAQALLDAIKDFAADPTSQEKWDAAKKAWLVSREPYGQTEVYRFRLSPIDSTDYENENGPEGDINAWPLGEALIDAVIRGDDFGDDQVGTTANSIGLGTGAGKVDGKDKNVNIIADSARITIDQNLIAKTATAEDERDVIAGYHALEYILWGQDLNEKEPVAGFPRDTSAGQRTLADFVEDGSDGFTVADGVFTGYEPDKKGDRRLKYMYEVAVKLVADLKSVRDGWANGAPYRTSFTGVTTQAQADKKLAEIMTGMGTLSQGELAGERMQIALTANSQEDEHSCFSDNTHRDIWLNAEGVSNSYYGEYEGYDSTLDGIDNVTTNAVSGYGIDDYLASLGNDDVDAAAKAMEAALTNTQKNYTALDKAARNGTPFDNMIVDMNAPAADPVKNTILALNDLSSAIQGISDVLGLGDVVDDDGTNCDTSNPVLACPE